MSCKSAIDVYNTSPHKISASDAKNLYDNYHSRFNGPIKEFQMNYVTRENDIYYPTEYVWVSLEDLKCYVRMLDEVAAKNEPISGVAIYLGAYGPDKQILNQPESKMTVNRSGDYAGRITNFMVPTYEDRLGTYPVGQELNKHKPFYITPYNPAQPYKGTYVPINFNYLDAVAPVVTGANPTDPTGLFFNELNAMPPKKSGSGNN